MNTEIRVVDGGIGLTPDMLRRQDGNRSQSFVSHPSPPHHERNDCSISDGDGCCRTLAARP